MKLYGVVLSVALGAVLGGMASPALANIEGFVYGGGVYTTLRGADPCGINNSGAVIGVGGGGGFVESGGNYTILDAAPRRTRSYCARPPRPGEKRC